MSLTIARQRIPAVLAAGIVTVLAAAALVIPRAAEGVTWTFQSLIVRAQPGQEASAADAIRDAGGRIRSFIDLVDGFVVDVPVPAAAALARDEAVLTVTPDYPVRFQSLEGDSTTTADEVFTEDESDFNAANDHGSMLRLTRAINADWMWAQGYRGQGVGVALIDSGVVPVEGLRTGVVNGPDISLDSTFDEARHLDTFGHGTHMAGIITGNPTTNFTGVAPDSTLINVKVGATDGAVDVSQVLSAIDWVVQHRNDPGLNIRVLNLSFGTDGVQDYLYDPLTYAVEQAWRAGIVVVVAAGNGTFGTDRLNNPAYDPYVLTVGAADLGNTPSPADDTVPTWSAHGDAVRHPDVVAPGRSVVSLRSPGSFLDVRNETARVGTRFFRGTGTSQAAAMTSGAAALLLQHRPTLTPDQVKALLQRTARPLAAAVEHAQGSGLIDLRGAARMARPTDATQTWPTAVGTGSLEAARGSVHLFKDGVPLYGEVTPLDATWDGTQWLGAQWSGSAWTSDQWSGAQWSGGGWSGASWSGASWLGGSWLGAQWSGAQWSGAQWSGAQWSGAQWSGGYWTGAQWSGAQWSGAQWSGAQWSGAQWSGAQWSGAQWSTAGWGW